MHFTIYKLTNSSVTFTQGDAIEAVANPKKEPMLNSKIKIGSCYTVDGYVAIKARRYLRVVPHDASLRLGNTASFDPIHGNNIPTFYFDFATYEMLESRVQNPKPLVKPSTARNTTITPTTGNIITSSPVCKCTQQRT